MSSSYTISARFTLQATGENNNTWGVILNSGVFQLVDDAINGRLALVLNGAHVLTTVLGATDEARMAFLDVTGGSGGTISVPAASKSYFARNGAAGPVNITQAGAIDAILQPGDAGPMFADGAGNVYGLYLGGKRIGQFITDGDQAIIAYVNSVISAGNQLLPPAAGEAGRALIVRGASGSEVWIADFIQQGDVVGLSAALATLTANDALVAGIDYVHNRAFYGDLF